MLSCIALAACASSSHELIGTPRPEVTPDQVQLYTEVPARPYERIALVRASSNRSLSFTFEGKAEVVVRRLKQEAGKLGANGVLLEEISDAPGPAVGAGVGTWHEGPRGTIDLGVGASTLTVQRYGRGIAIYVPGR